MNLEHDAPRNKAAHTVAAANFDRPVWVQLSLNALLLVFLLSAGAFIMGILRTGVLFVGGYATDPSLYFFGCVAIMTASSFLIVLLGSRFSQRSSPTTSQ